MDQGQLYDFCWILPSYFYEEVHRNVDVEVRHKSMYPVFSYYFTKMTASKIDVDKQTKNSTCQIISMWTQVKDSDKENSSYDKKSMHQ